VLPFDPAIEISIEFAPAKFEGKTPVIYVYDTKQAHGRLLIQLSLAIKQSLSEFYVIAMI